MPGGFDFGSIGSFLGPVGSLLGGIGGFLGHGGGADLAGQQQFSMQQLQMQEAFQREMAQNSIQWRVQDAQKAGISPLAALGAPTFSPTVSAPPIDYGASGGGNNIGSALRNLGANVHDLIGKTQTAEEKAAEIRRGVLFDQQVKSNDLELQIKASNLALLNRKLQTPSAADVGGSDGLVKIVPDKVTSNRPGDLSTTAGTHPQAQTESGPDSTYATPTSPAVINNPGITNPFLWQWAYNRYGAPYVHRYERWFDRNVTNPIRSVLGMPEFSR